jgi:GrpB-like predicted nucleotidyltransferase (UPF0157 family)
VADAQLPAAADPALVSEDILGLESGTVRVVPYDPVWADLYGAESARLATFLAAHGVSVVIEHTGSTAVPGLAAKPIIDILAGRHDDGRRDRYIAALEAAGYSYRGEQGIPGRDFFRRGEPRKYHVHLTRIGSPFWKEHLAFREYLRAHPEASAAYATLKHELAARHPRDREAYIDGKTEFVREILARAGG